MTIREIIELLREQGHEVSARERTDGGLRITSIDGKRYQGSAGNAVARTMTGATLSEARIKQLNVIIKASSKKKKVQLTEEMKKEIRRIQRLYKQNQRIGKGGKPTRKNIRYVLTHYGMKEAERRLAQAERYARGLAYDENIDWLINYFRMDKNKLKGNQKSQMSELIRLIKEKRAVITESALQGIWQSYYSYREGAFKFEDFIQNATAILNSL